jgi:hypothetical protein
MTEAITSITTVVGDVVTLMTTGDIAIFFWSGVVGIAISIVKRIKR